MIHLVAALTRTHVIGKNNAIPWDIPAERQLFRTLTWGHTVVMGRKTWESIGHPLEGRRNIVVSRANAIIPGCLVVNSPEQALQTARSLHQDVYVIGGSEIYRHILPVADVMHLSFIIESYEGDAFFPSFDITEWTQVQAQESAEFVYTIWQRQRVRLAVAAEQRAVTRQATLDY